MSTTKPSTEAIDFVSPLGRRDGEALDKSYLARLGCRSRGASLVGWVEREAGHGNAGPFVITFVMSL